MFQLINKNPSGGKQEYFYKIPRVWVTRRRSSCDQGGGAGVNEGKKDLREQVYKDIIGHNHGFVGPFGWTKCKRIIK